MLNPLSVHPLRNQYYGMPMPMMPFHKIKYKEDGILNKNINSQYIK